MEFTNNRIYFHVPARKLFQISTVINKLNDFDACYYYTQLKNQ